MTTRVKASKCPHCDKELDSLFSDDESLKPGFGDVSICINCGELLELDRALQPIPIQESTVSSLSSKALQDIQRYKRQLSAGRAKLDVHPEL